MVKPGIVLMDKAEGLSSAQALARLKKQLCAKKIGHAGTLDPFATGLLVCLTEGATRLAHYAQAGRKTYSGVIRLGITTDSDDLTGRVLHSVLQLPGFSSVEEVAMRFVGRISQKPPQFSAVKIGGERAYKRARQGLEMELAMREVEIDSFTVEPLEEGRIFFRVVCSKGTYIRSLARDLGASLGCGACLEQLRREVSEPFNIAQADQLDDLNTDRILSWSILFPDAGRIKLDDTQLAMVRSGVEREINNLLDECEVLSTKEKVIILTNLSDEPCGFLHCVEDLWKFGGLIG